jgi:hypothetical protein
MSSELSGCGLGLGDGSAATVVFDADGTAARREGGCGTCGGVVCVKSVVGRFIPKSVAGAKEDGMANDDKHRHEDEGLSRVVVEYRETRDGGKRWRRGEQERRGYGFVKK